MPATRIRSTATALVLVATLCAACGSNDSGSTGGDGAAATSTVALQGHQGAPAVQTWAPWPQAMYDAQHSGASPYRGPRTGRIRWTRELEGNVTPGPVVAADGTIYAASNAGVLHALEPDTGEDRWTLDEHGSYGLDLSTSPAILPSGLILWPGPQGNLIAVTPDGEVAWRLEIGGQVSSPAVGSNGMTVVGNGSGLLVALVPDDDGAHESWRVDLADTSYGSPALSADGATAYQSTFGAVSAVRDGKILWRTTPAEEIIEVSPAVAPDGTIVIGSNDAYQYGLDPDDGSQRWRYRRGFESYSSPGVTRDGIAYFGDHGNVVTGLDASTGKVVYRAPGSTDRTQPRTIGVWTAVAVDAGHTVYAGTRQGLISAADRSGKPLWTYDTGETIDSYPALTADGALVVGVTDGRLISFKD